MKKILIIIMICFILIGCSKKTDNNIKNETNNSVNNNETVEENETIEENATYVNFQGEDIDINSNSDKSRKVSIINDMNIFALDNYEKDSFKKIISNSSDNKVSLKTLINNKDFDTSTLEEKCKDICNLDESYIIVDYNNKNNPIVIDLKLLNDDTNNNYEIIFGYAKKIYEDKKYLNAEKYEEHYRITIDELKTKYGYDISKITCNKKSTIIEFRPTEESDNNNFPIFVYGC